VVADEFNEIYLLDLGGDVRDNPKLSGTKHNVFGIQTGVAISFMIKRQKAQGCRIFYARRPEFETADDKLAFLGSTRLQALNFEEIRPDLKHSWINLPQNDFDSLMPIAMKETKAAKNSSGEKAIFKLYSLGIVTNRDDWAYDDDRSSLAKKISFFCEAYRTEGHRWRSAGSPKVTADFVNRSIKWTSELEAHMRRGTPLIYDAERIVSSIYRPYVTRFTYFAPIVTHRPYQNFSLFPSEDAKNVGYSVSVGKRSEFGVIAVSRLPSLDMFIPSAGQLVCLWRYNEDGQKLDNITDWALNQFRKRYQVGTGKTKHLITREAILRYVYGVLHDPVYREKYALNLKREFPRIPFYKDFWQWADWGEELMDLHLGYESVTPAKLKRVDMPDEKARNAGLPPKCMLKADKDHGRIIIDGETTLIGIPPEAWDYKLGNRSALEWILDQYKEKKPKDRTIREKFNTYRFANYKEKVIDLLIRVTTVSVRTVSIVTKMKEASR
jgi:predicted helicase